MKHTVTDRRVPAAFLLILVGLSAAQGQNFPAPGQSIAPPPPAQAQQQQQTQGNFPAPGQAFAPPPQQQPGGFQASPGGFPGPGGAPAGGPPAKCQEIMTLHQEREKRGGAIQAAIQRKATPGEVCGLVKNYVESETKMIKFIEANGSTCGFPPDALPSLKASQKRTLQVRTNACNAAAGPPAPKAPTLGEVLGTNRVPDSTSTRTGRGGALDTLSGNPVTR